MNVKAGTPCSENRRDSQVHFLSMNRHFRSAAFRPLERRSRGPRLCSLKAALHQSGASSCASEPRLTRTRRGPRGFTLIELVISSALMSLILFSGYLCLRSGVSSQKLVESRSDILQNARVALAILSADLRGACTLSKEYDFLGMHRMLGDMQADNLDFATHNYTPRQAREGDWCEVSYFLDKSPEEGDFRLWRRRDPTPDPEPLSGGTREEIARGLRGLKLEYYDGFEWFEEWGDPEGRRPGQAATLDRPNLSGMPEAVRVTVWFDSNPRRKTASDVSQEAESVEPPFVFQTVIRLNVAAAAASSSASGPTGSNTGGTSSQSPQGAPSGRGN